MVGALFLLIDGLPARPGLISRSGQVRGASIVLVWRNHKARDKNTANKNGDPPKGLADTPASRLLK